MPKGPVRYDTRIQLLLETEMLQAVREIAGPQNVSRWIRAHMQKGIDAAQVVTGYQSPDERERLQAEASARLREYVDG